jgi:hypothetical protein
MLTEIDKSFLIHAEKNGFVFDKDNGKIYNGKGKEIGSKSKKIWIISFTLNSKAKGITRARAIWLHANGEIPEGYGVGHKSEDLSDDNLSNLELTTNSTRNSKRNKSYRYSSGRNNKITIDIVNEDRKYFRENPNASYDERAEKRGITKTSLIHAISGKSWKNATEEPVAIRKGKGKPSTGLNKKSMPRLPKINKPLKSVYIKNELTLKREETYKVVKSLISNNRNLTNKGIMKFLCMRNLPFNPKTFYQITSKAKKELSNI